MQKNKHPKYQEVLFEDSGTGKRFVVGSAIQSKETMKHEGKEYPFVRLAISSYSHPYFVGKDAIVDAEGRVDKFQKKYKK